MGLRKAIKRVRHKVSNYFRRAETGMENTWERYKAPIIQVGAGLASTLGPAGVAAGEIAKGAVAQYEARKAAKEANKMGRNMFAGSKISPFRAFRGGGEGSVDFMYSGAGGGGGIKKR